MTFMHEGLSVEKKRWFPSVAVPRARALVLSAITAIVVIFLIGMSVYLKVTSETVLRVIIYGMSVGGAFALVAIGFSLIFGVANLLNMAQAAFFLLGGYLTWIFVDRVFNLASPQEELILATIISMVIMFFVGVGVYVTLIPLETSLLGVLMVTSAISMIVIQTINWLFGTVVRSLPYAIAGMTTVLGVKVPTQYLVIFVVSIAALLALLVFLSKAKFGKAIRAAAQDREAAMLMGVSTIKVNATVFGISAVLSTLAAAVTCSIPFTLEPLSAPLVWLGRAFVIVVLGGLGSLSGTVIAAFIIAYAGMALGEINPSWFPGLGAYITDVVVILVILIVLLVRPTGILGRPIKELI